MRSIGEQLFYSIGKQSYGAEVKNSSLGNGLPHELEAKDEKYFNEVKSRKIVSPAGVVSSLTVKRH